MAVTAAVAVVGAGERVSVLHFPSTFLFGTATAATQIEGGCTTSDWYDFARRPGAVAAGDTPDVACNSWQHWRRDIELQQQLGMTTYRMSVEWARIEPSPGLFDVDVVTKYSMMLRALRAAGIEPMITLHHFTLPAWLAERGGVLAPGFVTRFVLFASKMVTALGDHCRLWITINEPSVYVACGYVLGKWPPGIKGGVWRARRVLKQLQKAHDRAYSWMKTADSDAQIGMAHHLRPAIPATDSRMDLVAADIKQRLNDSFALESCEHPTQDFFGINYYSRDVVHFDPRAMMAGRLPYRAEPPADAPRSDLGWEIYPEGLGQLVRTWASRSKLPIYITENGLADADDSRRTSFITDHLSQLAGAIADGIDVRGYYHWSLLDNFEWADGYAPRFGLVEMNYETGERCVRPSGMHYARIARKRSVGT